MFVLIPGLAEAQATTRSHTVVEGETLWGLAELYCGDPFAWPVIYEANRSEIQDPNLISPDQMLTVPCAGASEVVGVQIVTPDPGPEVPAGPFDERSVRTIFHRDLASTMGQLDNVAVMAMSRDASWSASWLQLGADEPWAAGHVSSLLAGDRQRSAMPYKHVRIQSEAEVSLGDIFQLFRAERLIEGLGSVLTPTGMLSVTSVREDGFEGVVLKAYGRILLGDLVIPAPDFDLQPGDVATSVSSGSTAEVVAFGEKHVLQQLGDIVLMDSGSSSGVAVGDEYVQLAETDQGWSGEVMVRLQVVRVTDETASARIMEITRPYFKTGTQVQLDRKMR